jgi:hypothetical protein
MKTTEFPMLAKTFKGLEQVLATELVQLGANNVQVERRAVSFTGDLRMLYTANMCLRTATRVLVPIASFKAQKADDIYNQVKALDWAQYMTLKTTFQIDATVYLPAAGVREYCRYGCRLRFGGAGGDHRSTHCCPHHGAYHRTYHRAYGTAHGALRLAR